MTKKSHRTVSRKDRHRSRRRHQDALKQLAQRVEEYDPDSGTKAAKFTDLPLTAETLKGLEEAAYVELTDIQREAIPPCLKGRDVLGAARTGSGKTLAFLVPVLERLMREKWSALDGVGALVISPTRELAVQTYEVLVKIGKYTSLSAGLVIGGKDYTFEKERIGRMNILVGTPGRILQHMDESAQLNVTNLQMLVLDEADRILDMGFSKTIDAILDNLPPQRQTLLFSATQTKTVKDLARLSLVNPVYVSTTPESVSATPESLQQFYVGAELFEKMDILWSFVKAHLKCKIIAFFSSSKQVHFAFEIFRKLRPGVPLMKLHGRQKEKSRLDTTMQFTRARYGCLFATDVVARGLDFPAVDWVVQVDCPEDATTYIHRVGRCARFGRAGKSLLMLTPSEEKPFLERLQARKIAIRRIKIKGSKKKSIMKQTQSLCFESPELKYLGQKAFTSYCRSVFIQKDRAVFDLSKLPLSKFAVSLGLPGTPHVSFLQRALEGRGASEEELQKIKARKNASRKLQQLKEMDEDGKVQGEKRTRTKYDKMFERQNQSVLTEHYQQLTKDADDEDDGDFLTVKRRVEDVSDAELPALDTRATSKRALKRALSKVQTAKKQGKGSKMVFDDAGKAHAVYELQKEEEFARAGTAEAQKAEFLGAEREKMDAEDKEDKKAYRAKRAERRRWRKEVERRATEEVNEDEDEDEDEAPEADEDIDQSDHSADLDRDLAAGEAEEAEKEGSETPVKRSYLSKESQARKKRKLQTPVVEIEQPSTIQDLEALTEKLIHE